MRTKIPISEPDWHELTPFSAAAGPVSLRAWLLDQKSLTASLKQLCADNLSVEIVSQSIENPRPSECELFPEQKDDRFLVREVMLLGSSNPWIYARSILPEGAMSGELSALRKLGNNPLGAWLFSQPSLSRGVMQVAMVRAEHIPALDPKLASNSMWGRRSVFFVMDKPILVTEIFLPNFEAYLKKMT